MNRKLFVTLVISGLLFTACGSESKSSSESTESEIKKRNFITVANRQDECIITDKQKLANFLEATLAVPRTINANTLISMPKGNVQYCENYNRTWDDQTCAVIDFEKATEKSCIFGFDFQK